MISSNTDLLSRWVDAIRINDTAIISNLLSELDCSLLLQETRFGDTILTFAASLGRVEIVRNLIRKIQSHVRIHNHSLVVSDYVDYETCRGKTPLVEAAKNKHASVVSLLLSSGANPTMSTKMHNKSALSWATAMGHDRIVKLINDHIELECRVSILFRAVSTGDESKVKELIDGGAPYFHNQEEKYAHELELKCHQLVDAKQNVKDLLVALQEVNFSKASIFTEIKQRQSRIEGMKKSREAIIASRRIAVAIAIQEVYLTLTSDNINQSCNLSIPPIEFELLGKALCTMLHIKVKEDQDRQEAREIGRSQMPYWMEIKAFLKNSDRFYHRIQHYHFEEHSVEVAKSIQVDGLPGTCSDHLPNMNTNEGSPLMTAIAKWLTVIFQSTEGHHKEHELVMEESTERDLLEANRIQSEVIISRSSILKQEYDDTSTSVQTTSKYISQLRRKMEVSRLMNRVDGGHTILSWVAALGNEKIVKLLLRHGGHTSLGDCHEYCATIIQVAFRHSRVVKQSTNSRFTREKDLAVFLRIKSLSNLIRERLLSIRLPFAEALVNGHSKVALILNTSELPTSQALNLFRLFCPPRGMIPRSCFKYDPSSNGSCDLISYLVSAGNMYCYETDPEKCQFVDALQCAMNLTENYLKQRRSAMEIKLVTRRETLMKKHKHAMISLLTSSIYNGKYDAMIKASEEGNISLDYEDDNTGMTPLIRAAMEDIHSPFHEWCINSIGERVTAIAFLLDRISPHRPNVDYENQLGLTALGMACMHGRLEAIVDLIDRGADIDRKSCKDGRTPFMLACLEGKVESVKVLLRYNSDGIKNSLDEAYALAVKEKQIDVVEYLDQLR
jgi:ankyrin repeat protein